MADETHHLQSQGGTDGLRLRAAFIPSKLDDAGLTAPEFRVFARIARRGECTEAISKMALGCRLNEDTVWKCLRVLSDRRMINRTVRPGATSLYRIAPDDQWLPPTGNEGAPETRGCPSKPVPGHRKPRGAHPPESRGRKGNSHEGNPLKGEHPPQFEPVRGGLYRREYQAMIDDAQKECRKIQSDPRSYVKDLRKDVEEVITFIESEKKDGWAKRVDEFYRAESSYERKNLKAKPAATLEAWKNRITEIRNAMNGVKS